MKSAKEFWEWVDTRMEEVGINSIRELETRAGFKGSTILRRRNDLKFPTVEVAEGMCQALKVDWGELWAKAGFMEAYSPASVQLTAEKLTGQDEEIYYLLRDRSTEFKAALIKTIKAWSLYEDFKG